MKHSEPRFVGDYQIGFLDGQQDAQNEPRPALPDHATVGSPDDDYWRGYCDGFWAEKNRQARLNKGNRSAAGE